ncbi:phosphoglycerate mutase [candidate division TA06 bacterium DG_24]|uniref:phosphoglycerate mutase (2,3-diphosphoglycerate-independent) n=3 Tax=Bacteria division TA06 TaxID=1156500 RepID=A0A0S8JJ10_UNCT6|nr:MAG: phosphoglycerate mutase [candidate division TA06 bacterium DG_24]KPK69276.1 MAG: phosphoglycerate mutase [candidate division TA06 bacterium SM23_40]KPL09748.1 MAG: phosphoglycerate mutase [candidate division TA06 bacterium SM1_40]
MENQPDQEGDTRGRPTPMADAVRRAYRAGEEDEALEPIVLVDRHRTPVGRIGHGDSVIFYDLRGEREVELTQSLTEPRFDLFPVEPDLGLRFVTMIGYDPKLAVRVAFPPVGEIEKTMSDVLAANGLRQIKICESEKAIHVSYFLNGRCQDPVPGEERIIIPSPRDVGTYDEKPEMSAADVRAAVVEKLADPAYDVIIANFANVDVVGHIENTAAIKEAVETVDSQLGVVVEAALATGVTTIVTSDHGTVERWLYPEGAVDTGHTTSPVPFICIDPAIPGGGEVRCRTDGELTDIAPTILELLGLAKPDVMTGRMLLVGSVNRPPDTRRRILLVILDGWGVGDGSKGDLIAQADTPVMDGLTSTYPATTLQAAGVAVGLPDGTVGNSEAGHMHIGAGRRIYSDRVRVDRAIEDGSFFRNEAFLWAMDEAKRGGRPLHLLGIVSFFSSHGSVDHLLALLDLAKRNGPDEVYIHAMLGRRGERPESGARYIEKVEREAQRIGTGMVVSVIGRFWALDREENWDRIEKTYRTFVYGDGTPVSAGPGPE